MITQANEGAAFGGDAEDRISSLPEDVIHYILELSPIKDGARTCILSKKWRYLWSKLPNLVLDKHFCSELAVKSHYVDKILLHHIGDIVKFNLDVSGTNLPSNSHIDSWLLNVTRNGVKQLTLKMPLKMADESTYTLPSCVLNCPPLTHLELFNCAIMLPSTSPCFQNLLILHLENISFIPTSGNLVIKAPFLSQLTLSQCVGSQFLNFVSPQLGYLNIHLSHFDIGFMDCKNLEMLHLQAANLMHVQRLTLEKFLCRLPMLRVLTLSLPFLELLSAGIISNGLPFTLDYLWHLILIIDFQSVAQVSYVLELIKDSPNLTKLEIWVFSHDDDVEAVLSYLDTPACLDRPLNKLKHVVVHKFSSSKAELLFVELLLARAPSLIRMSIEPFEEFSRDERNDMSSLMRFRRASTEAELFYLPNDL